MNKTFCIWFVVTFALFLSACEVIPENDRLKPLPLTYGKRTHLLVEYTGFRCVNCPTAAQTAEQMRLTYGERLVTVAVHPASNPFTQGAYDYTCPAADTLYRFMGGTASTPFPTGNIDLSEGDNGYFTDPADWSGQLTRALMNDDCPSLTITTANTDAGGSEVTVTAEYNADIEARLALWLLEDSVQGVQAMPDGTVNTAYIHRHLLRGTAFDSPWGVPATGNTVSASIAIPKGCDRTHCSVVAVLMDKNDYHVLNTYEKKINSSSVMPVGSR